MDSDIAEPSGEPCGRAGDCPGNDPHDLGRFVEAQEGVYGQALGELRAGRKRSHWMWFVFPQFEGLGASSMSRRYAIRSVDEAGAYIRHPVLGARLAECTEVVNGLQGLTAREIFGTPDDRKFHSSMTLFEIVSGPESPFGSALEKYFSRERDARTIELVTHRRNPPAGWDTIVPSGGRPSIS